MAQKHLPAHIGIILDGNRRWAKARGLKPWQGHEIGFEKLRDISTYAFKLGIKYLSVFAFSTENWKRNQQEVNFLLRLFKKLVISELDLLNKDNIKLIISGDISAFDKELQRGIKNAVVETSNNRAGILNVCLNYGGRNEIIRAIKNIVAEKISAAKINEAVVRKFLYTHNLPDPDLIIRTSGEQRLSGFLTWQSVYSELYFCPKMWPDFSQADLNKALHDFAIRQRRFGGS